MTNHFPKINFDLVILKQYFQISVNYTPHPPTRSGIISDENILSEIIIKKFYITYLKNPGKQKFSGVFESI